MQTAGLKTKFEHNKLGPHNRHSQGRVTAGLKDHKDLQGLFILIQKQLARVDGDREKMWLTECSSRPEKLAQADMAGR
jgi:hypothetical protein